jgi:hypothetical protein
LWVISAVAREGVTGAVPGRATLAQWSGRATPAWWSGRATPMVAVVEQTSSTGGSVVVRVVGWSRTRGGEKIREEIR